MVDDSSVFRSQIRNALATSDEIEVAGVAANGKVAIQKLKQTSVDVVTLDMEMPEMDGAETIAAIRKMNFPVKIIVFSSQTKRGSERAIQALTLGADDILVKPEPTGQESVQPHEVMAKELVPRVLQFRKMVTSTDAASPRTPNAIVRTNIAHFSPKIVVVGSSTGGPACLEKIFGGMGGKLKVPILIAQHMPPVFTATLARRLQEKSGIECGEGVMGEPLENKIYLAPGDFHMTLRVFAGGAKVFLDQGPPRNSVRPAVDNLFESAATLFGKTCLGIVLTGMGEDGLVGCRAIKNAGGGVVIQDSASSVVFGMPGAVFANNLQDEILAPEAIQKYLKLKCLVE